MEELVKIFEKYSLDKLYNKYDKLYHNLLNEKKDEIRNVLEIGIGTIDENMPSSMFGYKTHLFQNYTFGNSLRAWRDYFQNAKVIGIDIDEKTMFNEDRIETFCSSSFDELNMEKILSNLDKFDLVIDDGLHNMNANLDTLKIVFPYLKDGGIYVIEDINQIGDWYIDKLIIDDRFTSTIGDCKYTIYDNFNEDYTRIIVINK